VSLLAVAVATFGLWVVWQQVQIQQNALEPLPRKPQAALPQPDTTAGNVINSVDPQLRKPERIDLPSREMAAQPGPMSNGFKAPALTVPRPVLPPAIDADLSAAFTAMVEGNLTAAKNSLQTAESKAGQSSARSRVRAWVELLHYVSEHQALKDRALNDLKPGSELAILSGTIEIIESTPTRLIFSCKGTTQTVDREKISEQIIEAALDDRVNEHPSERLAVGAYHLTKQPPDRATARQFWETAAAGGADASPLLSLLSDPVIGVP